MQRLFITLLIILLNSSFFVLSSMAQPKFAKKVQKAIVSVNTYDKQGNLLHQGTGVYVGQNGEAIADFSIFKGAYKATVIDSQGKQSEVESILGADDSYSLVRFHVDTKGNAVLNVANTPQPKGTTFYAIAFSNNGTVESDVSAVNDTSLIQGKYVYYGLAKTLDSKLIGCPVFNADGVVAGILHAPIGEKSYVMDIRYRELLKIEAIATRSASVALGNIFIPKGLPDTAEEALVYTYFKSRSMGNDEYMDLMNRFINNFPQNAEGYLRRATPLIDLQRFDEAEADLQKYLSLVEDKAVGNFNLASTIYNKLTLMPEPAYDKWTADAAIAYVDKALELNEAKAIDAPQKHSFVVQYNIQKAQLLSLKKDYDAAIDIYNMLNQGEDKSPSYLYAISLAREGRGDSISSVIEPLDSALSMFGTPLPADAANYVMRRGQLFAKVERYREAVQDYNQYCYLVNNNVSAVFYYERSQLELNARMYQQAISDINLAIEKAPRNALYYVEKASLCIRVNLLDECIDACQKAIILNPDIIDTYRILGYAQLQKGDKTSARQNLQKAIDLGDENAKSIMQKYL